MFALNTRKMDALHVFLLTSGASSLFFTLAFSVNMVYQVQTVGLTPLQLVLVGTTLELTAFLFEVPTGIVADVYSRRLSVVIGYALIGLGFIVEGAIPSFGAILLAQVLWGIGYTFTSGAHQAWITDEIGEENVGKAFLRSSQIGSIVGIAGTLVAITLGSLVINLPIVLAGVLFVVLSGFLVLVMPETGFKPTPREERTTWQQMRHTLRGGLRVVRGRPVLLAIMGIGLFIGLYSEGYDRLNTKHMLESFTLPDFGGLQPVVWMGLIGMAGGLISAGLMQVVMKRLDMTRDSTLARASFLITALLVGSLAGFALAGNFVVAVLLFWAVNILRSLLGPIEGAWINQHIDSDVRATVISMRSQVDAFGQMFGGPPVGFLGERLGVRAALIGSSLILSPTLYLYTRVMRQQRVTPAESVAVAADSAG